ncbi:MAG: oligosaccharide flippase family protein [Deltaproteobacteria bacterium]|nr:oligosaccharide flippase family protein [Deltaproteobacteria bacterium]
MRFGHDTMMTLLVRGASTLLGIVFSIITVRLLGAEGRGILTLVFLIPSVGVTLAGFGLGSANVYFLNRGGVARETLFANSVVAALGFSILSITLFWAGWQWFGPRVLPGVTPVLALMGLTVIPLALLNGHILSLLQGAQRFLRMNLLILSAQVIALVTLVVALGVFHAGVGGAALAQLLAAVLALGLTVYMFMGPGDRFKSLRPNLDVFRRSLSYGLREHVSNIAMLLSYRIDIFFIAAMAGARAVGLYAVAVMVAELFLYLPRAVSTVLVPRVANGSVRDGANNVARTARVVSVIVGACVLVVGAIALPLVRLVFSSEFSEAAPALVALLPGIYALSISRVLSAYFTGTLGQPGLSAKAATVALGLNLPLNLLLIPSYGITGAAVASSVAYGAHFLISLWMFCSRSGYAPRTVLVPCGADLDWIVAWLREARPVRWRVSPV